MVVYGPLLDRSKEKEYSPPPGLEDDIKHYLAERVYNDGFSKPFKLRRLVKSTIQSVMKEIFGKNAPKRPDSIWMDFGLDEEIFNIDADFERGLEAVGRKFNIELSIHPCSYVK